ncbi:hypothetical protein [Asticcacaulis benevestitus]|uniref:Lipoprotein n=1 Tax=Asticcacaulis benevestitus DSM 16100 = ATCC BAA-896 TaxID=1121022 RepID=V4PI02_9CAUL|nr:hypothetical protein [Asticcacaulis benevestitus]ESQ87821.1 hypothetical protein ABENE_16850 [Asticcacaulis benevestitus DSM 16100 = ATCC BAA-896]
MNISLEKESQILNAVSKILLLGILSPLFFSACVSFNPVGEPNSLDILREALILSPSALEQPSERQSGRRQYALAIVYEYGLHGATPDRRHADELKRQALAPHGTRPITQYFQGVNGKPGRTALVYVSNFDLTESEALTNDLCASALENGRDNQANYESCLGEGSFKWLKQLWAQAV